MHACHTGMVRADDETEAVRDELHFQLVLLLQYLRCGNRLTNVAVRQAVVCAQLHAVAVARDSLLSTAYWWQRASVQVCRRQQKDKHERR